MAVYGNKYINSMPSINIENLYESIVKETSDNIILFESLNIINESSSILLEVNIKEKLSNLWNKFINFCKEILRKIKLHFAKHVFKTTEEMLEKATPNVDEFNYNMQILNTEINNQKYSVNIDKDLSSKLGNFSENIIKQAKKIIEHMLSDKDKFNLNQLFGRDNDSEFSHEAEKNKENISELIKNRIEDYDNMTEEIDSINKAITDYNIEEKETKVNSNQFISDSKEYIKTFGELAKNNKDLEDDFYKYLTKIEKEKEEMDHKLDNFDQSKVTSYPTLVSKYIQLAAKIYKTVANYSAFLVKIYDIGDFEIRRNLRKYYTIKEGEA